MISLINNNPIIYAARKQTPCNCNNNETLLKGKLEENIQKVQDQNERKTELEQREGKEKEPERHKTKEEISKENTTFSDETKRKAIQHIAKYEGYRSNAYKYYGDVWTIGYGHTKGVKAGDRITKEEAENLLFDDFDEHSKALRYVRVPLTENQKIVLSSMAYNMGLPRFINSDFVKILNSGDYEGAANEFEKYVRNDAGIIQPGLVKRRAEEKKLFLTPD